MSTIDTPTSYETLYKTTYAQAEWYKKTPVRKTIIAASIVTVIALLVIGALTAHALRVPSSSLGTIGHNLMSESGLKACCSLGFVGAVIAWCLMSKYQKDTIFYVADYIPDNKGFLYEVKDEKGNVKAYLLGTIHILPRRWKKLNMDVTTRLTVSRKIYLEYKLVGPSSSPTILGKATGTQNGIDSKIVDYVRKNSKDLDGLESIEEHTKAIKQFYMQLFSKKKVNQKEDGKKSKISPREVFDRLMVAWLQGNEAGLPNSGESQDEQLHQQLIVDRNEKWIVTILSELRKEADPIFIAVGNLHLFDNTISEKLKPGLINMIENAGYTVQRVGSRESF